MDSARLAARAAHVVPHSTELTGANPTTTSSQPAMTSAYLDVLRRDGFFEHTEQPYEIVVDGEVAGRILAGNRRSVPLSPGRHDVWMRLGVWRSPLITVDVADGEHVPLRCWPNYRRGGRIAALLTERHRAIVLQIAPGMYE
jgi:hypothetical protein